MGVVTVTVDDETEERFRNYLERAGQTKGKMGEIISDAVDEWLEKREGRLREAMEEGVSLGEVDMSRDEMHERTRSA
ncbi:MAG: hypothetical protein ABEI97_00355 [Candidatus Nanohaloarchaea archaeon]